MRIVLEASATKSVKIIWKTLESHQQSKLIDYLQTKNRIDSFNQALERWVTAGEFIERANGTVDLRDEAQLEIFAKISKAVHWTAEEKHAMSRVDNGGDVGADDGAEQWDQLDCFVLVGASSENAENRFYRKPHENRW